MLRLLLKSLTGLAFVALSASGAAAETITIKVGYGAGGGFDLRARLFAEHLPKYLEGAPDVVVSNVPGAGSAKLARMLTTSEPADGSVLAVVGTTLPVATLLRDDLSDLEITKTRIVGTAISVPFYCVTTTMSGVTTLDDFLNGKVKLGASGRGSSTYVYAALVKNTLGANFDIITGFKGAADINSAMKRGEIAGRCSTTDSGLARDYAEGEIVRHIQLATPAMELTEGVPWIMDLIQDDLSRAAAELIISDMEFSGSLFMPTGTSDEIVETYRKAYDEMLADAEFIEDAKLLGYEVVNKGGANAEAWMTGLAESDPATIEKARELIK